MLHIIKSIRSYRLQPHINSKTLPITKRITSAVRNAWEKHRKATLAGISLLTLLLIGMTISIMYAGNQTSVSTWIKPCPVSGSACILGLDMRSGRDQIKAAFSTTPVANWITGHASFADSQSEIWTFEGGTITIHYSQQYPVLVFILFDKRGLHRPNLTDMRQKVAGSDITIWPDPNNQITMLMWTRNR